MFAMDIVSLTNSGSGSLTPCSDTIVQLHYATFVWPQVYIVLQLLPLGDL